MNYVNTNTTKTCLSKRYHAYYKRVFFFMYFYAFYYQKHLSLDDAYFESVCIREFDILKIHNFETTKKPEIFQALYWK